MTARSIEFYERALWCYTDRLSYSSGDKIGVRVSNPGGSLTYRLTRIGALSAQVATAGGQTARAYPFDPSAYRDGCQWPTAFEIAVDPSWPSGYYRLHMTNGTHDCEHFFVVRFSGKARPSLTLVLATNTYHAYNSWGGKCLYGTDVPVSVAPTLDTNADRTPDVSTARPFSRYEIAAPRPMRVPDLVRRDFGAGSGMPQAMREHTAEVDFALWDVAAGYLNKWEHTFVQWAERHGYELGFLTQDDLESGAGSLDGHRCFVSVGHDEYWSWPGRDAVESFVEAGGAAVFLSGNAAYWQVRHDPAKRQMTCYKYSAHRDDPFVGTADQHLMTGMWADPIVGRPETLMKGTTFTRAGYSRVGLCMGSRPPGFTVCREDHWALEGTDLFYGDMFGDETGIAAYEVDGCAYTIQDGLPVPTGTDGADPTMDIIALAPASLGESETRSLAKGLGHTDAALVAERLYGADTPENRAIARRGAAAIVSFRKGAGEVFSASGTEWAWGLTGTDPYTEQITHNVLRRLGRRLP